MTSDLKSKRKKWMTSPGNIEDCQDRLEKYGYAPNPYCQVCHGGGFVHPIKYDGKVDYSRVIDCPAPDCIQASYEAYKRGEKNLAAIGISPKKQTFDSFKLVPGVKDACHTFKALATGEADYVMILCYGGVGNGKTHLCNALALTLNERGIDTRLYTVSDMASVLKKSISDNTTEALVGKLKSYQALILDDFGIEYGSPWEMAKLEEIIDARYRQAIITVLTTNKNWNTLPERIVSRFSDSVLSRIVLNQGKDYRRR